LRTPSRRGRGPRRRPPRSCPPSGCRLPQRKEPSQEEHLRVRLLPPGEDDRRHP
jgi:hypothetical protein